MFRKTILSIVALIFCGLVVLVIDGVRRVMAIERLEKQSVIFDEWNYRYSRTAAPRNFPDAPAGSWHGHFQRIIASPRRAVIATYIYDTANLLKMEVKASMMRDVAVLGIDDLFIWDCQRLSPETMSALSQLSTLRTLFVHHSGLANEELNRLWSRMPALESLTVDEREIGDDAFRDVKAARKLRELDLSEAGITDRAIAHLRDSTSLEGLSLNGVAVTEDCAPLLAAVPALRSVRLVDVRAGHAISEKLRGLNPKIVVKVEP